jgi:hypothetical protein
MNNKLRTTAIVINREDGLVECLKHFLFVKKFELEDSIDIINLIFKNKITVGVYYKSAFKSEFDFEV